MDLVCTVVLIRRLASASKRRIWIDFVRCARIWFLSQYEVTQKLDLQAAVADIERILREMRSDYPEIPMSAVGWIDGRRYCIA